MKTVSTTEEFRKIRKDFDGSVGFVPTMGFLHEGHLELVRQARANNDVVVASIFVNPTQFAPDEDFSTYPRSLERDLELFKKEKTDIVFTPVKDQMYAEGYQTFVNVSEIEKPLEGSSRPQFFTGVATIVCKLFNIVQPDQAYFGQKDAQQLRVIQRMVKDLDFGINIVSVPIVREAGGLAMSSRNAYLNETERKAATVLFHSLSIALEMWDSGIRDAESIRSEMLQFIANEPLARVDYVSVADTVTLKELDIIEQAALVSMAVYLGKTRLIDNTILE